jgi:xanthine dehydrogenase/oxidase
VSISKLMSHLTSNASLSASFPTLVAHMKRVGNWQVRNVGCWAGNLTMAKTLKFASDLATIFMGAGALLTVRYQGQTSVMSVYDYLWTEHDMDELLVLSMEIPALAQGEVFQTYRSAIRQNSAHALLNAAFRVTVSEEGVITAASLAFGLAQDRAVFATAAQELLVGRKPDPQTLALVLQTLEGFELIEETHYKTVYQPEGKESYRRSLVNSFVYKFLVHLMGSEAPASIASTTSVYARGPSSGKQTFQTVLPAEHPGSRPQPKIEAEEQASGETIFHDDEGLNGCLHACFVPCTKAPARVVSIDPAEALKMPGVVAFVDAADIPGANTVAFASPGAEELFVTAGNSTVYVGQPVGCIVANTRREAEAASAAVQVVYAKEQEGIYSLEDAIEKKSYQAAWAEPRTKEAGDSTPEDVFSQVRASGGTVIEGEMRIGGQSHFAMEKNICLAIPQDCGRFELHHSTQMPDAARGYVAGAIQSSQEKIQIICRRLGGGFGGKATKNIPTSIAATVCARKLKQPVKLANSIGQDMMMAGNARHPMLVKWKLAADKSGTIKAVDCCSYIDAGCAEDFSDFIAGEMLENIENCYNVPVYRSKVYLLKTNTASNTAVRAPGLIQALAVTETMLDELAAELSIDKEALRVKNMMTQAECTPNVKGEGAPIAHYNLPRIWKELNQSAKFEERQAAVDAFNASNRWKKRGLAAVPMRYGLGHGHVAGSNVTINVHAGDGSIEVFHSGQEMGQGLTTKCATTISAALGVPLDKIYVHGTNTSVVPNDTVSGGSTTSEAVCRAADLACEDLLARLAPVASKLNESKRAEDSTDSAAAAEATWEEIVAAAWGGGGGAESLSVNRKYSAEGSEINPKGYFGLGAGCTEVEVDVLTGQVSVLRADILYDCGHSLNPTIDIGQAEGAYVMGLGFFLQEETMYSPEGELISDGTWEYKPPLYNDIPEEFNVTLLKDSPFPNGVRSSKAVGEPPLLMAVSALTATRAAIRASRLERGRSGRFALCVPATVDRVQAAADVTADELVLKVVREFVPAAQA